MSQCPCCSNKPFERCCERFLSGKQLAKTPEQLMRSRFTAFFLGGYGQYLLDTWAPKNSASLSVLSLNERETDWTKLVIIYKTQQGDRAVVEFKAYFLAAGKDSCHHERSRFIREGGCWLYLDGDVLS